MTGNRQARQARRRGIPGPSWFGFGCLLAVGEVIMLALVFLHPGSAVGVGSARSHLATSGGHTGHSARKSGVAPLPTTTLPATPAETVPSASVPTGTVPSAAVPTPSPVSPPRVVTAPGVLPANIAPEPNFLQSCSGAQYDDSQGCVGATMQAIQNGRSHEGLPPMALPSNWAQLSPEQQIFVSTNLERTVRGLPPMAAMATALDRAAEQGAAKNTDPAPTAGFPYSQWGSNWAGAVGSPLEALYFWMYDDGAGSANVDCTPSNPSGCWGHRVNILLKLPCQECLMGTGWSTTGYGGYPSLTELLVETSGNPAIDFTWRQESAFLS